MKQMTPIQIRDDLDMGIKLTLIDVREWGELQYGMLTNAIHIPMKMITARINVLKQLKDTPIVLICRSGKRSNQVGQYLECAGFNDIINLTGGMNAWAVNIDKSMTVY